MMIIIIAMSIAIANTQALEKQKLKSMADKIPLWKAARDGNIEAR